MERRRRNRRLRRLRRWLGTEPRITRLQTSRIKTSDRPAIARINTAHDKLRTHYPALGAPSQKIRRSFDVRTRLPPSRFARYIAWSATFTSVP